MTAARCHHQHSKWPPHTFFGCERLQLQLGLGLGLLTATHLNWPGWPLQCCLFVGAHHPQLLLLLQPALSFHLLLLLLNMTAAAVLPLLWVMPPLCVIPWLPQQMATRKPSAANQTVRALVTGVHVCCCCHGWRLTLGWSCCICCSSDLVLQVVVW